MKKCSERWIGSSVVALLLTMSAGCAATHGSLETSSQRAANRSSGAAAPFGCTIQVEHADLPVALGLFATTPGVALQIRDDGCDRREITIENVVDLDALRDTASAVGYRLDPAFDGNVDYVLVPIPVTRTTPSLETRSFSMADNSWPSVGQFPDSAAECDVVLLEVLCPILSDAGRFSYDGDTKTLYVTDSIDRLLAVENLLDRERSSFGE